MSNKPCLHILIGQDHYLLNEAAITIKNNWRALGESDEKILDIVSSSDWRALIDEANSYSLLAPYVLLDARWEKKTLDTLGKDLLLHYIQQANSRCLIVLRAPHLTKKQLEPFSKYPQVLIKQATPLSSAALLTWIKTQLTHRGISVTQAIPALIQHYTQGNMLACAQVIAKLSLTSHPDIPVTEEILLQQMEDESIFQSYELADACLSSNREKIIHFIRQASHDRMEPTLLLWLLTQEIRLLIQLFHMLKQSISLATACSQLKIWPQKGTLYQKKLHCLSLSTLHKCLTTAHQIDLHIKSNHNAHVWQHLEALALSLCPEQPYR